MYKQLLKMSYSQIRDSGIPIESMNNIRKILTFKDSKGIDAYSTTSDVIVYFDITADSTPLLLVERIVLNRVAFRKLKKHLKIWNSKQEEYISHAELDKTKSYVSIIVVAREIHNKLLEVVV